MIVTIGQSLDLSTEDLCLAEITALLHDIGRFEQFKRYKTFSDYKSEDHAALGVQVIESNRLLHSSAPEKTGIIIHAVRYHNHLTLPGDLTDRCLFFLKLLRDADKIDIWHVVTDYYENIMENRNQDIELGLPDEPHISMPVYHALMSGRLVRMSDLKTLNDFKLLQMGWIYDINFPKTFQIIGKKGYLEKIRKALPQSSIHAEEIYTRIKKYLEGKIHTV
ncbi:MAG: HD domain-containing protein [Deltaproteobacteria bacterium]|nr:HD domain-containing protein [Deltaproteobacteria bacterium]